MKIKRIWRGRLREIIGIGSVAALLLARAARQHTHAQKQREHGSDLLSSHKLSPYFFPHITGIH